MKDDVKIESKASVALRRLQASVARLNAAVDIAASRRPDPSEADALRRDLTRLRGEHGALKQSTIRVAERLDNAIRRLSTLLKD